MRVCLIALLAPAVAGDLMQCSQSCIDADYSANFHNCNHDGSSDCSESKCCSVEGWQCFEKNKYYSACTKKCNPDVKDALGESWTCKAFTPSDCTTLSRCQKDCQSKSGSNHSVALSSDPCRGGSLESCQRVCHYPMAALEALCKQKCVDNCPAAGSECPNGLSPLLSACYSTHKASTKCAAAEYRQCITDSIYKCKNVGPAPTKAPDTFAYHMMYSGSYCKSSSADRIEFPGISDLPAAGCARQVSQNSGCSPYFYSDGKQVCKCIKKGKTCTKATSSKGAAVYQVDSALV